MIGKWDDYEPSPQRPAPTGDPSCPVCKACSCYMTCFSGMKGFPKTSSNWGHPQASCETHRLVCGIKHYQKTEQLTILEALR